LQTRSHRLCFDFTATAALEILGRIRVKDHMGELVGECLARLGARHVATDPHGLGVVLSHSISPEAIATLQGVTSQLDL
jgi:hypothetical protein